MLFFIPELALLNSCPGKGERGERTVRSAP